MIINQLNYRDDGTTIADFKFKEFGKTEYSEGEYFNLAGYKIVAVYTNLTEQDITSQCTFSPNRPLTLEDTEIIIYYKEKTFTIGIQVSTAQIINYLMIYDGTLGESGETGANACIDISGGWNVNTGLKATIESYVAGNTSFDANCIHEYNNGTKGCMCRLTSKNMFDLTEWSYSGAVMNVVEGAWGCSGFAPQQDWGEGEIYVNTICNQGSWTKGTKKMYLSNISNNTSKGYKYSYIATDYLGTNQFESYTYAIFLTKADDYNSLCEKAGLDASLYSSVSNLVSNSSALEAILNNEEAVCFMTTQCTGDFMVLAVANATFLTFLNESPYKTKVYANEHWNKFLSLIA